MTTQQDGWPKVNRFIFGRIWGNCQHCGQSYTAVYNGQPSCLRCSPQRMCYTPAPKDHAAV